MEPLTAANSKVYQPAGIASMSLASTPAAINVGGNLVTAEGTLAFSNGTTEAIDQVNLPDRIAPTSRTNP